MRLDCGSNRVRCALAAAAAASACQKGVPGMIVDAGAPDAPEMGCLPREACTPRELPDMPCDPVCQTGCDEGERCAHKNGVVECELGEGDVAPCGAGCSPTFDNCGAGSTCATDEGTITCRRYCFGDGDCPEGEVCVLFAPGFERDLGRCFENDGCNPIDGTGCDAGFACFAGNGVDCQTVVPLCLPAGPGGDGSPCVHDNDCGAGYTCVYFDPPVCRKACTPAEDGSHAPCDFGGEGATCNAVGLTCGAQVTLLNGFGACYVLE